MAIKDIFKMIKADRYTQDGREELIKAQEAVTEDVTYKPGDISRKTGLQKQPDGSWKPVKNAPAQSKKQAAGTGLKPGALEEMAKEVDSPEARQNYDDFMKAYKERERREISGDPSASGSAPSADWEKDIPNASNEELENIVKLEEKLPRMSEQSKSEFSPKIEKAKAELAKRGETVTKMSDLVAQKSRPDSAPTGRQPTPEMLEREKMRQSPEAKARRDKLDAEHPRTETGAPKFETEQENAQYARGLEGWDDVNPDRLPDIKKKVEQKIDYYKKYDPYAMLGKKTGLTAAQKSAVQQNMAQAKENLAFYTGQLEGINKKMGGGSNDSAPRILTGDCKVRIKKSK